MELSLEKQQVLKTTGNLLILGGPGSGKTTIALLKADHDVHAGLLKRGQKVLFLSFARATVARVKQCAGEIVSAKAEQQLEIGTYHGFAWTLLRSHGYLLNAKRGLRLISPHDAAARFAELSADGPEREIEMRRMFAEEGVLHFDLFANCAADLLHRSKTLARIITDAYPIIVLDEFQDTNSSEWRMIQALGSRSTLIALADPDQRIYEFRGADPKRIGEFVDLYKPTTFDFGLENNRSNGTDIGAFGNDLLNGANIGKAYQNVSVLRYRVLRGEGMHIDLKIRVLQALIKLQQSKGKEWALAVLVPTNQLMMDVSDYLSREQRLTGNRTLPALQHDVAFDASGPSLAAGLIAVAMERGSSAAEIRSRLLLGLRDHIRGRKGNESPGPKQLALASAMESFVSTGSVRGSARRALIDECSRIAEELHGLEFLGDPGKDWLTVRYLFERSNEETLTRVAQDATYLRLLHRSSLLRSRLGELWRNTGCYRGAEAAVRDALLQEHFSNAIKDWKGVHVMTIHKSKGKEFDEVIIYEGAYKHRIVYPNESEQKMLQKRRNLRVAVTRAKRHTTVMTPERDPCIFL